jgi:hypothetical protein
VAESADAPVMAIAPTSAAVIRTVLRMKEPHLGLSLAESPTGGTEGSHGVIGHPRETVPDGTQGNGSVCSHSERRWIRPFGGPHFHHSFLGWQVKHDGLYVRTPDFATGSEAWSLLARSGSVRSER